MSPPTARRKSLETAKWAVRLIERFVYRELAEGNDAARSIQRLAVGLRRKLDTHDVDAPLTPPSAPEGE